MLRRQSHSKTGKCLQLTQPTHSMQIHFGMWDNNTEKNNNQKYMGWVVSCEHTERADEPCAFWHSALGRTMYESIKRLKNPKWIVPFAVRQWFGVQANVSNGKVLQKSKAVVRLNCKYHMSVSQLQGAHCVVTNLEMKLKWYAWFC